MSRLLSTLPPIPSSFTSLPPSLPPSLSPSISLSHILFISPSRKHQEISDNTHSLTPPSLPPSLLFL